MYIGEEERELRNLHRHKRSINEVARREERKAQMRAECKRETLME